MVPTDSSRHCPLFNNSLLRWTQPPVTNTGAVALDINSTINYIVTTGTDAITLADGLDGQVMILVMITKVGTGTVTPVTLTGGATIAFANVGETAILLFTNSSWAMIAGSATLAG